MGIMCKRFVSANHFNCSRYQKTLHFWGLKKVVSKGSVSPLERPKGGFSTGEAWGLHYESNQRLQHQLPRLVHLLQEASNVDPVGWFPLTLDNNPSLGASPNRSQACKKLSLAFLKFAISGSCLAVNGTIKTALCFLQKLSKTNVFCIAAVQLLENLNQQAAANARHNTNPSRS